MSLDTFLEGINECPDDELTTRYGVRYDHPILLKADFERICTDLDRSPQVEYSEEATQRSGLQEFGSVRLYRYTRSALTIQVMNWIIPLAVNQPLERTIEEQGYQTTIMIGFDGDEPEIEGVSVNRAIVLAITDLAEYIKEKNIPACLPYAKMNDQEGVFYKNI